jgi:PKD repeat protein
MRPLLHLILLMAIFISSHPTACTEIAYSSGPNSEKPVGYANMTEYKATDKVSFTVSARGPESTSYRATRDVDSIKEEINKKVNPANELVRDEGLRLVGSRSGAQRIDQICSIYDYIVGNWTFVSDPRGLDVFQYANYTLKMGKDVGSSGKGDCDDFSILLASLVESIGGTPRIILAYSPATGGHAYTEVYLGNKSDKDVNRMLSWLRTAYNVSDINIHTDLVSGDVWLNMDWWKDPGGANHPGGPFYQAASQVPIFIQEEVENTPLTPIENLPPRPLLNCSNLQPEVDEVVRFDASASTDPDGKIVDYEWDFGDGDSSHKSISQHIYSSAGKFQARLKVTDNEGDSSIKALEIDVKEPLPEAIGTYSPREPKVGDVITFDASQSKGKRGRIVDYEWDFDDGYSGKRVSIDHQYLKNGTYDVNLTVTNDKGVKNSSIINVDIGQRAKEASSTIPAAVQEQAPIIAEPATNQKPILISLSSDPQGSAEIGTTVVWAAQASDPENGPLSYKFLLNSKEVQSWSPANTWSWNTAYAQVGPNWIEVQVKDGHHGDEFVSLKAAFTISAPGGPSAIPTGAEPDTNRPPILIGLSSEPQGSAEAGTTVVWTAQASDPDYDPLLFRFLLNGAEVTGWSPENTWSWNTAANIGANIIEIQVKDDWHGDEFASLKAEFLILNPG